MINRRINSRNQEGIGPRMTNKILSKVRNILQSKDHISIFVFMYSNIDLQNDYEYYMIGTISINI